MSNGNGDGFTSAERNLLRVVERYGGSAVPAGDVARGLGTSRAAAAGMATVLKRAGLLNVRRMPKMVAYEVTDAGRAELAAHKVACLLVEVDDQVAEVVAAYLGTVDHVISVTVHNDEYPAGCCCQHCPHNGNCRD